MGPEAAESTGSMGTDPDSALKSDQADVAAAALAGRCC